MLNSEKLTPIFQGVVIALIVVFVLSIAKPIIVPLFIAIFLSFILDKLVQLLMKIKIPKILAVIITIIFTFFLFYLMGLILYSSIKSFSANFPFYEMRIKGYFDVLTSTIDSLAGESLNLKIDNFNWFDTFKDFSVSKRILSGIGSFLNFFWNVILILLFIVYILIGKDNLELKIQKAFEKQNSEKITNIIQNITSQVQVYLATKTLVSIITGVLSYIVFISFGLDFAILWAFVIFVFNFIPSFGSIVASIIPITIALIQFDSWLNIFWLALLIVTIQFMIGNVIEPKMMGDSLNLSPLMVIFSLIFWGWLWGVPGMLISVPILAVLTIIFENFASLKFISVFLRGDIK